MTLNAVIFTEFRIWQQNVVYVVLLDSNKDLLSLSRTHTTRTHSHIPTHSYQLPWPWALFLCVHCNSCPAFTKAAQWGTATSISITAEWMFPKEPGGVWANSAVCDSNSVRDDMAHNRSIPSRVRTHSWASTCKQEGDAKGSDLRPLMGISSAYWELRRVKDSI